MELEKLRLECLKLASLILPTGSPSGDVLALAGQLVDFILGQKAA
jgi:hypothetical protein